MGGFFQVTPSNFPPFVSFKGILSRFSYIKPNPFLWIVIFKGSDVTSPTEIRGGVCLVLNFEFVYLFALLFDYSFNLFFWCLKPKHLQKESKLYVGFWVLLSYILMYYSISFFSYFRFHQLSPPHQSLNHLLFKLMIGVLLERTELIMMKCFLKKCLKG